MAERKKYDYEDSRLKAQKFVRYKEGCKLWECPSFRKLPKRQELFIK